MSQKYSLKLLINIVNRLSSLYVLFKTKQIIKRMNTKYYTVLLEQNITCAIWIQEILTLFFFTSSILYMLSWLKWTEFITTSFMLYILSAFAIIIFTGSFKIYSLSLNLFSLLFGFWGENIHRNIWHILFCSHIRSFRKIPPVFF